MSKSFNRKMRDALREKSEQESDELLHDQLDIAASIIEYPVDVDSIADPQLKEALGDIDQLKGRLSAIVDQPGDSLAGWLITNDFYEDWPSRFSGADVRVSLGFASLMADVAEDARAKVTEDVALTAYERANRVSVGIGPLLPVSPESREATVAIQQREAGRQALVNTRQIFMRFPGGNPAEYREPLLDSTQAIAEDRPGEAYRIAAVELIGSRSE